VPAIAEPAPAAPRGRWWLWGAGAVAALVAAPILAVASNVFVPRLDVWAHLLANQIAPVAWNTGLLLAGVALLAGTIGVGLGWLVATRRFPLRGLFDWALVLPLAVPAYVSGFVFLALLDFGGPVQGWLRSLLGEGIGFRDPRSRGLLIVVMSLAYYPYVYLLARTAFGERSVTLIEASRSLGQSSRAAFWRLALPLARPALVAGLALALLETLADFGTVSLFGHPTFTVAIYRVWFGMFDREAAAQLAAALMALALLFLWLERRARGRARYAIPDAGRAPPPIALAGGRAWAATAACGLVLGLGFLVPVAVLGAWTLEAARAGAVAPSLAGLVRNTVTIALAASVLALGAALLLGYGLRLGRARFMRPLVNIATVGYAAPGSVVAVGVLLLLTTGDRVVHAMFERVGITFPFLLATSVAGLLFAYLVRFIAVAFFPLQAGLTRIPPALDEASRGMGVVGRRLLFGVHAPLLRGALFTAGILVIIEVMKEMPATMLIRPRGFDTLAVEIWHRTSEALWVEAAPPALAIVACCTVLVGWLTHLRRADALRAGGGDR
jgi:iron(III) transport system permease protein